MNEFNHEFGTTPKGFSTASADELMQVEGGKDFGRYVDLVRRIVQAIKDFAGSGGKPRT